VLLVGFTLERREGGPLLQLARLALIVAARRLSDGLWEYVGQEGLIHMVVALGVLIVLLLGMAVAMAMTAARNRDLRHHVTNLLSQGRAREKNAVAKSRIIHVAKISEQFAPLLPGFPDYNLKDFQWVGGAIDAIVWDGLEDGGDVDIVLLDVKTGRSSVSPRQRRIREAVEAGRVRFEVFRFRPEEAAAAVVATDAVSGMTFTDVDDELDGEWDVVEELDDVTFADEPPMAIDLAISARHDAAQPED